MDLIEVFDNGHEHNLSTKEVLDVVAQNSGAVALEGYTHSPSGLAEAIELPEPDDRVPGNDSVLADTIPPVKAPRTNILEKSQNDKRATQNRIPESTNNEKTPEGDDLIKLYLKEIGRYPLLTKEGEAELSVIIQKGTAAAKRLANQDAKYTVAQQRENKRLVSAGKKAHDDFVNANLRLVVSIAKKYKSSSVNLMDLIQEGNLGLIHAVDKFDHRKGFKFSTYGTWWIKQAINRGIANTERTIRLPIHAGEKVMHVAKVRNEMILELGHEPTFEQLRAEMNLPGHKLAEIMNYSISTLSLSEPLGEEGDAVLGDLVIDHNAESPADEAVTSSLPGMLKQALDQINPRDRAIMRLRYGLDDGDCKTLEEIGEQFNLTRERIRQIEERVLTQLRHPSRIERLRSFLED